MGVLLLVSAAGLFSPTTHPIGNSLDYLAREVPAWSAKNKCYSCHNNGDAVRALFAVVGEGRPLPVVVLEDTLAWLRRPGDWDHNGGDFPNNDRLLARIQFATALGEAVDVGLIKDREPLLKAAATVAALQSKDGSWKPEGEGVGSPAAYGPVLATHFARQTLRRADAEKYRDAIQKAETWLIQYPAKSVTEAAGVLWSLEGSVGAAVKAQRDKCLDVIRKGRGQDGGWGPFVTSRSEPYDTALVLLALNQFRSDDEMAKMLRGAYRYMILTQNPDGSWPETTRPPGSDSYAQRISTTAWATLALLKGR